MCKTLSKDGLLAFWQNASSQGMSPSQTVAATGITPATQGQPPTTQVVATTIRAKTKKLMLGSIWFGHLNPDELPPSVDGKLRSSRPTRLIKIG